MEFTAYVEEGRELEIRPARAQREWIDNFIDGHPYGCLPMRIANQHGWEICSPVSFTAVWNGGESRRCLAILTDEDDDGIISSHFGGGIFSFRIPAVFRTEPGYDLVIQGPPNWPVDGASPMSGIVETDWLVTSIAMHWKLTQPNKAVRFRKGDPLCQVFPVRRAELEPFTPVVRSLAEAPELADYMSAWRDYRAAFNAGLKDPDSQASRQKWPGHYTRGTDLFDRPAAPPTHRRRLRLNPFVDERASKPGKGDE